MLEICLNKTHLKRMEGFRGVIFFLIACKYNNIIACSVQNGKDPLALVRHKNNCIIKKKQCHLLL